MDIPAEFLDSKALAAFEALSNNMKLDSKALAAFEALSNNMKLDSKALAAFEALSNNMKSARAASKALRDSAKMVEDARRLYDGSALAAFETLGNDMKSAFAASGALGNSVKMVEGTSAPTDSSVEAFVPPASPADLEDAPDGTLGTVTAKTLMRLRTWTDLCADLGGRRDENVEGLDTWWLEVARQIDECLSCLVLTAGPGGACWGCRGATLMPHGVVCAECAALVAQMELEVWFLTEGLEPNGKG